MKAATKGTPKPAKSGSAAKKARGFTAEESAEASLDDGHMWPTAFALKS